MHINLAKWRKARGLTQDQLAAVSGVARITIARIEANSTNPTIKTLERLANALKVPVLELMQKGA